MTNNRDDALDITELLTLGAENSLQWIQNHVPFLSPHISTILHQDEASQPVYDNPWDLNRPMIRLSPDPQDTLTLEKLYTGCFVFGSTGAGKSSASLQTFGKTMLQNGFGAIILTSTPSEKEIWRQWTHDTGRADDLIIVEPHGDDPHQFNFLDYEAGASDDGHFLAENLVTLLTEVNHLVSGIRETGSHGENESFFDKAVKELLRAAVTAILIADKPITIDNIRHMINTAPQTTEMAEDDDWIENSFCGQILSQGHINAKDTPHHRHDMAIAITYWTEQFPTLNSRTRTSITANVTGNLDILSYGLCHHMLSTETTITPDAALKDRQIILINTPVQQYFETGRIIAGIWKYLFMRAALRRDTDRYPHGVSLIIDEAHYYVNPAFDPTFLSVARRARIATLMLCQSVSQLYDAYGETKTNALLTNFVTKIFHNQSDVACNQYAADLIGKEWRFISGYSSSSTDIAPGVNSTGSGSMQLVYKVEPSFFQTLHTGGPQNEYQVSAVLVTGGGMLFTTTQDIYIPVTFNQRQTSLAKGQ